MLSVFINKSTAFKVLNFITDIIKLLLFPSWPSSKIKLRENHLKFLDRLEIALIFDKK